MFFYSKKNYTSIPALLSISWIFLYLLVSCSSIKDCENVVLLDDDFSGFTPGLFYSVVWAHGEYHYLPEMAPKGNWVVSCFKSVDSQRAWRVLREDDKNIMQQAYETDKRRRIYTHPMIIAGDDLWTDYIAEVCFAPESNGGQSGFVFRYRNDRCYYFFGINGEEAILKVVRHASAYHKPDEKILAKSKSSFIPGEYLTAKVKLKGSNIRAELSNGTVLEANDNTFPNGKIGLTSDIPTRYKSVKVTTSISEKNRLRAEKLKREQELKRLQDANPRPVLWKKIKTERFGAGRNLRFGDLNGDGQIDVLIGQVVHHGFKSAYTELSCLTAMTFDGEILWQHGQENPWNDDLSSDVGFQIYDLDGDGRNEVIYCMNFEIIVADGATGKTKYKAPTPKSKPPADHYPRILGDCLYFCDIRGTGRARDIVIKDRYRNFWVLNDRLKIMWEGSCITGHYPFAYDIDNDGKDELAIGYSLYDDNGKLLWSLDDSINDHADGVAVVKLQSDGDSEPIIVNAASDEGMILIDLKGNILKHHFFGHVQNPAVANFRDDLPGLEIVSINFWCNQGIIHYFDADGNLYFDFEPVQHGSMMLPVNWSGKSEEFYVLSANVEHGGLFDGWGRKVVEFPGDGHPDKCNAVLDVMGDCRDEIVVWDPFEIWVYTQDDNPKSGKLYKPVRNPLYNYSNYQATVSLPGWFE